MSKPLAELTSWKEIAEYLQVTVRTAQTWEKERGLPVRRIPGKRGRVYAQVDELLAWQEGAGVAAGIEDSGEPQNTSPQEPEPRRDSPKKKSLTRVLLSIGGVFALSLGTFLLSGLTFFVKAPALARVVNNTLIVLDENHRELWRRTFNEGLEMSQYTDDSPLRMIYWIGDLDSDGTSETLFIYHAADRMKSSALICFSEAGEELWRFVAGRALVSPTRSLNNVFNINALMVVKLADQKRNSVVVTSHHRIYDPAQVALISDDGRLVREYWHGGHIGVYRNGLQVFDIDGDGRSEIYAAGINDARATATLVVLDPETMAGVADQELADYRFEGMSRGVEIARLFFPRTTLNKMWDRYNVAEYIYSGDRMFTVSVRERSLTTEATPNVLYDLGPQFQLRRISFSDTFVAAFDKLRSERIIKHTRETEKKTLMQTIHIESRQAATQ